MLKIKIPKKKDYSLLAEIHNEASRPFLDIYSKEEIEDFGDEIEETAESIAKTSLRKKIVCATDDNNILGYAVFREKNDYAIWISSLYVKPTSQNKGVGKFLLNKIEREAQNLKLKIVALETHKKAHWAINFYKKNGYEEVNHKINEYPYSKILDKPPVPGKPILAKIISENQQNILKQ